MKLLIPVLSLIFSFNAFASTTYMVKYATSTVHATQKITKESFQTLTTPALNGEMSIFAEEERTNTLMKSELIPVSPLNFRLTFYKKASTALITESNSLKTVQVPAQVFTKPLIGSLIGGHINEFKLGDLPIVDKTVTEFVAGTLGHSNFKMNLIQEGDGGSCNLQSSGDVKCVINIFRNYQVVVE